MVSFGRRIARFGALLCLTSLVPRLALCWKPWPGHGASTPYAATHDAMLPYLIGLQAVGVGLTFIALFMENEGVALKAFAISVFATFVCWWVVVPSQLA